VATTTVPSGTKSNVTVATVGTNGVKITGYYAVLYLGSKQNATGYTPVTFKTVTGKAYSVLVENYEQCLFSHWKDTNSTNPKRNFTASGPVTYTAVYSGSCNTG